MMSRWFYYFPVLAYHRVGPFKGDHVPTVPPETFEWQLAFLARCHYRVLSLGEVADFLDRGHPPPHRAVAITFDDGYEETCTIAWPLLKRFGCSATVFITPSEVDTPGFVTWTQARGMARDGMVIGNHTMHHSYLPLVSEPRLPEELIASKKVIEHRIGQPVQFMSYPVGGFTPHVQATVKAAGYRLACTTNRASSVTGMDRFAVRRVKITERDRSWLSFRVKISGYYDLFRRLKDPS